MKVFCGRYCGKEGDKFMTASQDCMIRIYDTERGKFTWKKSIEVRADGESVPGLTVRVCRD